MPNINPTNQEVALYGFFVSTVTAAENRRQQASLIFILLISAGYTVIGTVEIDNYYYFLIPIIVFSIIWWRTIDYFRTLAEAKFKVIKEMEKSWQIKPFGDEYQYTKDLNKNKIISISLTHLEMTIPVLILIVSVGILLFHITQDFLY